MIERLTGQCVAKSLHSIVLDVNGVGYGVEMTESALMDIEISDEPLTVWIHTHVREDVLKLYGFPTHAERILFTLLISISGLGPKLAMGILGRFTTQALAQAVELEDASTLEEVPGIGARQSKKILLELKPKIQKLMASGVFAQIAAEGYPQDTGFGAGKTSLGFDDDKNQIKAAVTGRASGFGPERKRPLDKVTVRDLQSALENFGYKDKELIPILKRLERQPPSYELGELIRLALAELSGAHRAEGNRGDAALKDLF